LSIKDDWADGDEFTHTAANAVADAVNESTDRANHTGTQLASTISDFDEAVAAAGVGGIVDVVSDSTPQLGGNLDLNGHTVGAATAADLTKLHGAGTLTGSNTGDQDLSGYATTSAVAAGYQPLDGDLTAVAGLSPANDDVVQRKAGAWTNRTMAQLKTDLAVTKTDVGLGSVTDNPQYYAGGTDVAVADGGTGASTATAARNNLGLGSLATVTPAGTVNGTKFLRDDGTWATPPGSESQYGAIVSHGDDADVERPDVAGAVIWIGHVLPNNAIEWDRWDNTSGIAPTITTTVLNSMNVGVPTVQQLVSPGTIPILWELDPDDTLPDGLVLSSAGELSGTPTTAGAYSFTVTTLSGYGGDTKLYTGSIGSAVAPTITTTALTGTLQAGVPYTKTIMATGSVPLTWTVKSGTTIPAGLTVGPSTGIVSGTPTDSGSYNFTLVATHTPSGLYDEQVFTGSITGSPPTITTTSLNAMSQGAVFSQFIAATGTSPITWDTRSVGETGYNAGTDGPLPTGMALDPSTGQLYGTPSSSGSFSFTVVAHNAYSPDSAHTYTGTIASATPVVTTSTLNTIWRGIAFSQTMAASGATPVTWDISAGTLPAGLSINSSTGAITGTATTVAAIDFTVRATHATYGSGTRRFNTGSVLESTPNIVETGLNTMTVSAAFSQTLTLSAGGPSGSLVWSIQGTPTGGATVLSLNSSSGALTGTPATAGAYSITIRCTNTATSQYDEQVFSGTIADNTPVFVSQGSATSGNIAYPGGTMSLGTITTTAGNTVYWLGRITGTISTPAYAGHGMTLRYTSPNGAIRIYSIFVDGTTVPAGTQSGSVGVAAMSAISVAGGFLEISGNTTLGTATYTTANATTISTGAVARPAGALLMAMMIISGANQYRYPDPTGGGTMRVRLRDGGVYDFITWTSDTNPTTFSASVLTGADNLTAIAVPVSAV
jgi:hypothetical protein